MIEWKKIPRGQYSYEYDGKVATVWFVHRRGWMWTIHDTPTGKSWSGAPSTSRDEAFEAALKALQNEEITNV